MRNKLLRFEEQVEEMAPWLYILLIAIMVVAQVVGAYYIVHQQHQIRQQSANIQQERHDSAYRICVDQNRNHDNAIAALHGLLVKSGVPKEKRQKAAAPAASLIDALAPHQNCVALALRAVPSSPAP